MGRPSPLRAWLRQPWMDATIRAADSVRTSLMCSPNARIRYFERPDGSCVAISFVGHRATTRFPGLRLRHLAAIAHASVIEREIIAAGVPPSTIHDWAFPSRGQLYYLQSFVDLRTEPRWLPDFILPNQLKAEFIGRIYTAGHYNAAKLQSAQLKSYLSDDASAPVKALVQFPFAFLPGPLEGGIESVSYTH